jgi:hypothetical protein
MVYCTNGPYKKDSTMHIDTMRHKATYFDPRETTSKESTINSQNGTTTNDYKELNSFTLYPNPSDGILYINSNTCESFEFVLQDLDGTTIFKKMLNSGSKNQIDLSSFISGFYIAKIITQNYSIVKKIIKE